MQGFVLLEALVAMVLFSLGVMALVTLQAQMTRSVTQSKLRGEAAMLATQLMGQMWTDPANLGNYAIANNACVQPANAGCANWRQAVSERLPAAGAEVSVTSGAVTIGLTWALPGEAQSRFDIAGSINN